MEPRYVTNILAIYHWLIVSISAITTTIFSLKFPTTLRRSLDEAETQCHYEKTPELFLQLYRNSSNFDYTFSKLFNDETINKRTVSGITEKQLLNKHSHR